MSLSPAFLFLLCALLGLPASLCAESFKLSAGSVIVAEGDSLTYGYDDTEQGQTTQINGSGFRRSPSPWPETLAMILNDCAQVINRGYPGDRSVDGLVRWQNSEPSALTILMYGSNDALNNGHAPTGTVNVETFSHTLTLLIERRKKQGSHILVLSPPPIGGPEAEKAIAPYRRAAKKVAAQKGVSFMDTSILTKKVDPVWLNDNVHFSVQANEFLAGEIANLISCH